MSNPLSPSKTSRLVAGYQDRQGWQDTTMITILASFIEEQNDYDNLRKFLYELAQGEDAATSLLEADE